MSLAETSTIVITHNAIMKFVTIGENGLDRFVYLECKRLAPDGPWPVGIPITTTTNPGLAANVHANIQSLRPDSDGVFVTHNGQIIKTRYVDLTSNHTFLRIDENDAATPIDVSNVHLLLLGASACLISDYNKGALDINAISYILHACLKIGVPTFLDTKKTLGCWAEKATFIKINRKEYDANVAISPATMACCRTVIVTEGKSGITLYNHTVETFPGHLVPIHDLSGAGDTVLAALAVRYVETGNIREAVSYANAAGAAAVSRKGVYAVTSFDVDNISENTVLLNLS